MVGPVHPFHSDISKAAGMQAPLGISCLESEGLREGGSSIIISDGNMAEHQKRLLEEASVELNLPAGSHCLRTGQEFQASGLS